MSKWLKLDPHYLRQKCSVEESSFQRCLSYGNILRDNEITA